MVGLMFCLLLVNKTFYLRLANGTKPAEANGKELPESEISQNLLDDPLVNSKRRTELGFDTMGIAAEGLTAFFILGRRIFRFQSFTYGCGGFNWF